MTRPKFEVKNPKTKEEKLIVALKDELDKVVHTFVRKHNPGNLSHEMFLVLRDSTFAYMGSMLFDLCGSLAHKEQVSLFLDEAKAIFECYIDDIRKRYETHH